MAVCGQSRSDNGGYVALAPLPAAAGDMQLEHGPSKALVVGMMSHEAPVAVACSTSDALRPSSVLCL